MSDALGEELMRKFGVNNYSGAFKVHEKIDLSNFELTEIKELKKAVEKIGSKVAGYNSVLRDIEIWESALKKGVDDVKIKNVETFATTLKQYLSKIETHRIYFKDIDRGVYLCYFVSDIRFIPKKTRNGEVEPARCRMKLLYNSVGKVQEENIWFYKRDIKGKTIQEALGASGYVAETKGLAEKYHEELTLFEKYSHSIGKQFIASGIGTNDVDSSDDDEEGIFKWWRETKTIHLDKDGEFTQVVIDVFNESGKKEEDDDDYGDVADGSFWTSKKKFSTEDEDADEDGEKHNAIIPYHPMLVCFLLRRQIRLRIHVSQLEEYMYDKKLQEKLVLPTENHGLIEALMQYGVNYKDVIKGKGTGSIVICAGPPGTGKTLTAEIFSESAEKPLYSVQCSQLGTDPAVLEEELLKVFARASRWGAILLLDEADVYVRQRGDDIQQNAIVGVFLRTMEYYNGIMFLTTNKPDSIDDAVASRCIAKVIYTTPSIKDAKHIWQILSSTAGLSISEAEIVKVVAEFPNLSGRDIKNLLKLAIMINKEKKITCDMIKYAKKFKATSDVEK